MSENEYKQVTVFGRKIEVNCEGNPLDMGWIPLIEKDFPSLRRGGFVFRFADTLEPVGYDFIVRNYKWPVHKNGVTKFKRRTPDESWYYEPSLFEGSSEHTKLETHPTGAKREQKTGKGRPDLFLAGFPRAIMAICRHMDCELGRERNWEKGLPESSLVSSQFRHLLGYTSGVSDEDPSYNLTANAWNALVLLEEYLRVQDGVMPRSLLDVEKENG